MGIGMIVLAGGVGTRMGHSVPKQYILLGGKPIIVHVLERIEQISEIDRVVITCPPDHIAETKNLLAHRNFSAKFECIEGGVARQDSVYNGLMALKGTCETVIIHEAVRPFVTSDEYHSLIACENENAIFGVPIPFTVLEGHDFVEETLEREDLVNVQLPQKFNIDKLISAHEQARAKGEVFTEDASVFHRYIGEPVRILAGSERNIKITHPSDLIIGEAIYSEYILGKA
jgi:2-C-methyl-D-erythritol 4-phosphate cytidylyltransferase